jgi:hypothetical protein
MGRSIMIQIVEYDEFMLLKKLVEVMAEQLNFLKDLLACQRYLTRDQTLNVLGCCKATLWKMAKSGKLTTHKQGRKVRYEVNSVRAILLTKRIEGWAADKAIISALNSANT